MQNHRQQMDGSSWPSEMKHCKKLFVTARNKIKVIIIGNTFGSLFSTLAQCIERTTSVWPCFCSLIQNAILIPSSVLANGKYVCVYLFIVKCWARFYIVHIHIELSLFHAIWALTFYRMYVFLLFTFLYIFCMIEMAMAMAKLHLPNQKKKHWHERESKTTIRKQIRKCLDFNAKTSSITRNRGN